MDDDHHKDDVHVNKAPGSQRRLTESVCLAGVDTAFGGAQLPFSDAIG
jgi:hypothetical protein